MHFYATFTNEGDPPLLVSATKGGQGGSDLNCRPLLSSSCTESSPGNIHNPIEFNCSSSEYLIFKACILHPIPNDTLIVSILKTNQDILVDAFEFPILNTPVEQTCNLMNYPCDSLPTGQVYYLNVTYKNDQNQNDDVQYYFHLTSGQPTFPTGQNSTPRITPKNRSDEMPSNAAVSIFPNPFNDVIHIKYTLEKTEKVAAELFSLVGQQIKSVPVQMQDPGEHQLSIDAIDLPKGSYFLKLKIGSQFYVEKIVTL